MNCPYHGIYCSALRRAAAVGCTVCFDWARRAVHVKVPARRGTFSIHGSSLTWGCHRICGHLCRGRLYPWLQSAPRKHRRNLSTDIQTHWQQTDIQADVFTRLQSAPRKHDRNVSTDIQTHWQTDRQAYWQTDVQTHWQTDIQVHWQTDRQTDRRTDVQTHSQMYMYIHIDRQTDKEREFIYQVVHNN